jgi:anti-anti-sigma factor
MLKPTVKVRDEGGILVADFWDCLRLDPAPVQDLRKKFEEHFQKGGRSEIIVDLNGVGFAGSAALGGFLALHRSAKQQGGRVIFCNVDPTVFEVFRVSKLESLFAFAVDLAAALKQATSGSEPSSDGQASPEPSSQPPPIRRSRKRSS